MPPKITLNNGTEDSQVFLSHVKSLNPQPNEASRLEVSSKPTGYQDARNLRETIAIFKRRRALMSETEGFARCFMIDCGRDKGSRV